MFRRSVLALPLAFALSACVPMGGGDASPDGWVVFYSDAHFEFTRSEEGGARGYLLLTYLDQTARNFRPGTLPEGMLLEPQEVRPVWCGARPDCGIKEERLLVYLAPELVRKSAREGLSFVLVADGTTSQLSDNTPSTRRERIVFHPHQMRYAFRRAGIRF